MIPMDLLEKHLLRSPNPRLKILPRVLVINRLEVVLVVLPVDLLKEHLQRKRYPRLKILTKVPLKRGVDYLLSIVVDLHILSSSKSINETMEVRP